jgi:RND family efflux transporter MFP subunit
MKRRSCSAKTRGAVAAAVLVASALALAACGGEKSAAPASSPNAAAVPVVTVTVSAAQWPDFYEASGTVRARATAVISSKVMAYVREIAVQVGDRVKQGQQLVALDARDLDAAVRVAEAGDEEIASAIPEADNAVAGAKANLDLAQSTFQRIEELDSKKSISKQEFDEASARLKSAQAAYEMARAKRAELDSRRARAQREIQAAGVTRDYARIAAPFDGIVTAKSAEPGSLAAPGAPLLTIEREGAYRLEANVDESRLPFVKAGQNVEVSLDSLDRKFDARVSEIVPSVDAASRAYIVKIDLPELAELRSGMFGRARFSRGVRSVIAIPAAALVERGQLQSVFVVENGLAHARLVTAGERGAGGVEALSGLNAGEKIVSPAVAGLTDGARVEERQ